MMDSLKNVKMLVDSGLERKIAEACVTVWENSMQSNFATQDGLNRVERNLQHNLKETVRETESALRQDMVKMESSIRQDMAKMESSLMLKMGAMLTGFAGLIVALDKLL